MSVGDASWNLLSSLLYVLMGIFPISAGPRIIYCLCKMMNDPDQRVNYSARIKNLLTFIVIAECVLGIIQYLLRIFS